MRLKVNAIRMLIKRLLRSIETIVWSEKLWLEILERKVCQGCCLKFAKDCESHMAHL